MSQLFPEIQSLIQSMKVDDIPEKRKITLFKIVEQISESYQNHGFAKLNFICTHNSRRSIFSQVWAQTMAHYYEIPHMECYSSGTEVTRVHNNVIDTLQRQKFKIDQGQGANPEFKIHMGEEIKPIIGFSKLWDDDTSPKENYLAIMTCSDADENCPYLPGAMARLNASFVDPKWSDGSLDEEKEYEKTSITVGTHMKFIFGAVAMMKWANLK